jgi:hypothetical protein
LKQYGQDEEERQETSPRAENANFQEGSQAAQMKPSAALHRPGSKLTPPTPSNCRWIVVVWMQMTRREKKHFWPLY